MLKIGLSGNRYSGKKTATDLFSKIDIPIFDADLILRFILSFESPVSDLLNQKLPHVMVRSNIDASLVSSRSDFDKIVDIAEPILMKAYDKFCIKNKRSIYTIFKSSILFERDWDKKMDYNINIFCPKINRMERAMEIDKKLKLSDINNRLSNEIDDLEKNKLANFIIHNYGDNNLLKRISEIDQVIIDKYLLSNPIEN